MKQIVVGSINKRRRKERLKRISRFSIRIRQLSLEVRKISRQKKVLGKGSHRGSMAGKLRQSQDIVLYQIRHPSMILTTKIIEMITLSKILHLSIKPIKPI